MKLVVVAERAACYQDELAVDEGVLLGEGILAAGYDQFAILANVLVLLGIHVEFVDFENNIDGVVAIDHVIAFKAADVTACLVVNDAFGVLDGCLPHISVVSKDEILIAGCIEDHLNDVIDSLVEPDRRSGNFFSYFSSTNMRISL